MRLFFSVKIPHDDVFNDIKGFLDRSGYRGIKTVDPSLHHITLTFLGATDLTAADLSNPAGETAGSTNPFNLEVSGAGAFPTWNRPSVIWMGFDDQTGLQNLASSLDRNLRNALGVEVEKRPFHGHITLARVKKGASVDIGAVRKMVDGKARELQKRDYTINVNGFDLMRSTITPTGPVYKVIGSYPFY